MVVFTGIFLGSFGVIWREYSKIYEQWEEDLSKNLKKLTYYDHMLNKKIYAELYQKKLKEAKDDFEEVEGINFMTVIYDIKGEEIGKFGKEEKQVVALNEVSPYFIDALLATEDRAFYKHEGINYKGILRAIFRNIMELSWNQGGSSITQPNCQNYYLQIERELSQGRFMRV